MTPFDVEGAVKSAVVLVDTREQSTPRLQARLAEIGLPVERQKLNFGDYSVKCNCLSLADTVTIERKMSLDELCTCYTTNRGRFQREFERAQATGAKIYLLIENGSWGKVLSGSYRSRMVPQALQASILAWLARYNCQIIFCEAKNSGKMIREILLRELREHLMRAVDETTEEEKEVD